MRRLITLSLCAILLALAFIGGMLVYHKL